MSHKNYLLGQVATLGLLVKRHVTLLAALLRLGEVLYLARLGAALGRLGGVLLRVLLGVLH